MDTQLTSPQGKYTELIVIHLFRPSISWALKFWSFLWWKAEGYLCSPFTSALVCHSFSPQNTLNGQVPWARVRLDNFLKVTGRSKMKPSYSEDTPALSGGSLSAVSATSLKILNGKFQNKKTVWKFLTVPPPEWLLRCPTQSTNCSFTQRVRAVYATHLWGTQPCSSGRLLWDGSAFKELCFYFNLIMSSNRGAIL